jgi:hypothetical protein
MDEAKGEHDKPVEDDERVEDLDVDEQAAEDVKGGAAPSQKLGDKW